MGLKTSEIAAMIAASELRAIGSDFGKVTTPGTMLSLPGPAAGKVRIVGRWGQGGVIPTGLNTSSDVGFDIKISLNSTQLLAAGVGDTELFETFYLASGDALDLEATALGGVGTARVFPQWIDVDASALTAVLASLPEGLTTIIPTPAAGKVRGAFPPFFGAKGSLLFSNIDTDPHDFVYGIDFGTGFEPLHTITLGPGGYEQVSLLQIVKAGEVLRVQVVGAIATMQPVVHFAYCELDEAA